MRRFSTLLFPLLFTVGALCAPAFAQEKAPPIQQQMSAEEFKAAGLDKLTPAELVQLNQWLNRRIDTAATQAATEATERVQRQARGFLSVGGDNETIEAHIDGEFNGFASRRVYRLDNGQEWEQTDATRLEGVRRSNPKVVINPGVMGAWFMRIEGYNTRAKVRRVK